MLKKLSASVIAFITMFAMITPAFALAFTSDNGITFDRNTAPVKVIHTFINKDKDENNKDDQDPAKLAKTVNEFGVHIFDNNGKHKGEGRSEFFKSLFFTGTVTAVSSTGFTIQTKDNTFYTVVTDTAKIVLIPHTAASLADVKVGDTANVTGNLTGLEINALVVYDLSQNLKAATAKGTVTAISGNNLTVQVDGATQPLTVKVDGNTQVVNADHTPATIADVNTTSTVKVIGFWDTVLNVFNAIKIKLF